MVYRKMPSRKNRKQKAIQETKRIVNEVHKGRHRRRFRHALRDIKICNWYLNPTETWWTYISSFFY